MAHLPKRKGMYHMVQRELELSAHKKTHMWSCTLSPGHDGHCKPGRWPSWRVVLALFFSWRP